MSLQNIELHASLLPDLYKNHLVGRRDEKPTAAPLSDQSFQDGIKFLGGNEKKISIVIDQASHPFLEENDLAWLQRVLSACHLNLGDVAIINIHSSGLTAPVICEKLQAKKMLLLGTPPETLGMPLTFPQFKAQKHAGCIYLYAPATNEMNQDNEEGKALKSKFWAALKQIFEI